jgi:hypothetical protein
MRSLAFVRGILALVPLACGGSDPTGSASGTATESGTEATTGPTSGP